MLKENASRGGLNFEVVFMTGVTVVQIVRKHYFVLYLFVERLEK